MEAKTEKTSRPEKLQAMEFHPVITRECLIVTSDLRFLGLIKGVIMILKLYLYRYDKSMSTSVVLTGREHLTKRRENGKMKRGSEINKDGNRLREWWAENV